MISRLSLPAKCFTFDFILAGMRGAIRCDLQCHIYDDHGRVGGNTSWTNIEGRSRLCRPLRKDDRNVGAAKSEGGSEGGPELNIMSAKTLVGRGMNCIYGSLKLYNGKILICRWFVP